MLYKIEKLGKIEKYAQNWKDGKVENMDNFFFFPVFNFIRSQKIIKSFQH